jgi:hypothetical protein
MSSHILGAALATVAAVATLVGANAALARPPVGLLGAPPAMQRPAAPPASESRASFAPHNSFAARGSLFAPASASRARAPAPALEQYRPRGR